MLPTNTKKYISDDFSFRRQSLLESLVPIDLTDETTINGFSIAGTQPTDSDRRIIFKVDNNYYKFSENRVVKFDYCVNLENVLKFGNTVAELLAVTNISDWIGRKIYPIIALDCDCDSPVMPSIKIALEVKSFNDVYTKIEDSPIYTLTDGGKVARISSCTANKNLQGNAALKAQVRIFQNSQWSDWVNFSEIIYQTAEKVQFRLNYMLTTLNGRDSAKLEKIDLKYTPDNENLAAESGELCTEEFDAETKVTSCRAIVRHGELRDCEMKSYVCFTRKPDRRENILLGMGAGISQTFTLGESNQPDRNILQDTLQIQVDGRNAESFFYDTEYSTVTLTAPQNSRITATYEYNYTGEDWREMVKSEETFFDKGNYISRFEYALDSEEDFTRARVKFCCTKKSGTITNQNLGNSTGKYQKFVLPHKAVKHSIECTGTWSYDEVSRILTVQAIPDTPIILSYDWSGEGTEIYHYVLGFQN